MMPLADDRDYAAIQSFDNLSVVSNDLSHETGFTLTAVVRNEMFFLPEFLKHYRSLGVERFVFLDDHSDDGTRAFLARQSDCMVVESERRFADRVPIEHPMCGKGETARVRNIWINLLLQRFALDRWSVHVDADEFLRIPKGAKLQDVVRSLGQAGAASVCSVMLDMYPKHISSLASMKSHDRLQADADWYYDARQHFSLPKLWKRPGWSQPRIKYPGARARLMHAHGIRRQNGIRVVERLYKNPGYNLIRKPALVKFRRSSYFTSCSVPG